MSRHGRVDALAHHGEILTLLEPSPDGILVIDARTTLPIAFNDTAASQLGYSRDEFAACACRLTRPADLVGGAQKGPAPPP